MESADFQFSQLWLRLPLDQTRNQSVEFLNDRIRYYQFKGYIDNVKYFYSVLFGKEAKFMNEYKYEDIQSVELLLKHRYESYGTPIARDWYVLDYRFEFKDGKIIKAEAGDKTKEINEILDTDEGARYIGEFAFGLNPYVKNTMGDTLFDEKIAGSFHFTPGTALEESDNGNRSNIHWDIVCIQTPEFGGGKIYFDDVLIRKDGEFVLDELKALNPKNLI